MTNPPESVGDRIRKQREAHGWSQNELARRAMVARSWITRLENGDRGIHLKRDTFMTSGT